MVQIVEQTHDEKVEMYKKCTKLELIEMLISCNLHLEAVTKQLHKPVVVRGGVIEAQSLPLRQEDLEWVNSCVTQITPTEPLPAEGVEQGGSDGEPYYCEFCGSDEGGHMYGCPNGKYG